jgi:hypothetical protein
MQDVVRYCDDTAWGEVGDDATTHDVEAVIEHGGILCFPRLRFELSEDERRLLDPSVADGKAKNISLRGANDEVRGANPAHADALRRMIQRYRAQATALAKRLFPHYRGHLKPGNPSYRPVAVEGRETSWRKDDTRLHIDSFPSNPVHGQRLLRVFHNLNPQGQPRSWRVGEPFEEFARRFIPAIPRPPPGSPPCCTLHISSHGAPPTTTTLQLYYHALRPTWPISATRRSRRSTSRLAPRGGHSDQVLHAAWGSVMMEHLLSGSLRPADSAVTRGGAAAAAWRPPL